MNPLVKQITKCIKEKKEIDIFLEDSSVLTNVSVVEVDEEFITLNMYDVVHDIDEVKQVIKTYIYRLDCINGISYVTSNLMSSPNKNSYTVFNIDDDFTDLL